MRKARWYNVKGGGVLIVARRLPARLDVAVSALLPHVRMGRLAHQVRQDVWRALAGMRGFSPVVRVEERSEGMLVTAGGRLEARAPKSVIETRIAEVLEAPENHARWVHHARIKGGANG